jgi:CRP-like cAMP-binding protein
MGRPSSAVARGTFGAHDQISQSPTCGAHFSSLGDIKVTLTLTHEEIAQMIGASRETVTRLFSEFKKKQFLQIINYTFIITSKAGLENVLGS